MTTNCKYNIGDEFKVVSRFTQDGKHFNVGHSGTIVGSYSYGMYDIQWNHTNRGFHNCGGRCKSGTGWCVPQIIIDLDTELIELELKNPLPEDPRLRGIALKIIQLENKFKKQQEAKRSLANV